VIIPANVGEKKVRKVYAVRSRSGTYYVSTDWARVSPVRTWSRKVSDARKFSSKRKAERWLENYCEGSYCRTTKGYSIETVTKK